MKPQNMVYFSGLREIKHLMPEVNQLIIAKKEEKIYAFRLK